MLYWVPLSSSEFSDVTQVLDSAHGWEDACKKKNSSCHKPWFVWAQGRLLSVHWNITGVCDLEYSTSQPHYHRGTTLSCTLAARGDRTHSLLKPLGPLVSGDVELSWNGSSEAALPDSKWKMGNEREAGKGKVGMGWWENGQKRRGTVFNGTVLCLSWISNKHAHVHTHTYIISIPQMT